MPLLTQEITLETIYSVWDCGEDKVVEISSIIPYAGLNQRLPVKYYVLWFPCWWN